MMISFTVSIVCPLFGGIQCKTQLCNDNCLLVVRNICYSIFCWVVLETLRFIGCFKASVLEDFLGWFRKSFPRRYEAQHHDVPGVGLSVAEQRVRSVQAVENAEYSEALVESGRGMLELLVTTRSIRVR